MHFEDLNPTDKARIEALAAVRAESIDTVLTRFGDLAQVRRVPRKFSEFVRSPIGQPFERAGVRDGRPYVVLANGRIFFGHFPKGPQKRAFEYLHDRYSPNLTEATCCVAMDVCRRYLADAHWYRSDLLPPSGGTVAEIGAYLGHKTIKFVDRVVGPSGRVLAVEVMPDNSEVLRLNISGNALEEQVTIVEAGVWNRTGEEIVLGTGYQQNSLVSTDTHDFQAITRVKTDTLDNILAGWDVPAIDFLDIRVNGAEIEVLEGLDRELARVRVIYIAVPYSRGGVSTRARCLEILRDKGCSILPHDDPTEIYAATAHHALAAT